MRGANRRLHLGECTWLCQLTIVQDPVMAALFLCIRARTRPEGEDGQSVPARWFGGSPTFR